MKDIAVKAQGAVREAGKLVIQAETAKRHIYKKGRANFATDIDYAVQEYMLEELKSILPGSNVITEESQTNVFELEKPSWVLDPVDGTTNLMHGYRHSAISLALFNERKPVIGIIYNPYTDEMFTAEEGMGAALNGKKIEVTESSMEDCLIGFGTTPYDRTKAGQTFKITESIFMHSREIRRSGSAALDIAYVACGRLDGFFELNLQPWDFAAGIVILQEAGGKITNWRGESLEQLKPDSVLATNGNIHGDMLEFMLV